MEGAQDVHTDTLFVGLTRPATVWGVPMTAFVGEFVAVALIFLAVGNPLYLLLMAPTHAVLYLISANDPGVFSSISLWLKTLGRCRTMEFWGARSFSPFPTYKKWSK